MYLTATYANDVYVYVQFWLAGMSRDWTERQLLSTTTPNSEFILHKVIVSKYYKLAQYYQFVIFLVGRILFLLLRQVCALHFGYKSIDELFR